MKNFLKTLPIICLYALSFLVSHAEVSSIVFTTSPQTIRPNTLSEPITIQTQNNNGDSQQTQETIDLEFISTSETGEFLGTTGKPTQKYMSKNTAKRTFYYRDSSEGSFTISINAKGRESGTEWSMDQVIVVSSSESQPVSQKKETMPNKVDTKVEVKKEEPKEEVKIEVKEKEVVVEPENPPPPPKPVVEKPKEKAIISDSATVVLATPEVSTTTTIIYESPKKRGWWYRLLHFLADLLS